MGFGLLIFGYFLTFAFSLAKSYFFADIIGILLMIIAFSRLSEYNRYFRGACWAGMACAVAIAANVVCMAMHMLTQGDFWDIGLDVAKTSAALVMHVFMLLGCHGVTLGAGEKALADKSQRNLVLSCTYYGMYYLVLATSPLFPSFINYVGVVLVVYWFVVLFLNLALIYRCFGLLYPADGDTMESKRSRFTIVNKINDAFDRIEERKNEYRKQSMEMALAEAEKRRKEKSHKKKIHKKKK